MADAVVGETGLDVCEPTDVVVVPLELSKRGLVLLGTSGHQRVAAGLALDEVPASGSRNLQDGIRANDPHPLLAGRATFPPGKLELLCDVPDEGKLPQCNARRQVGADQLHEEV